ncbi:hypothetical protein J4433_01075 [Candidatus Pacearchaeota archaeon]|nr:hypothetical protein [Candidatus Pacearchaeota archaeon]
MGKTRILGYLCERCNHAWLPRQNFENEPKVCPKCKSPYWDRPRKNHNNNKKIAKKK